MKLTPAMEQFMRIKNEHPDCILLFRMGDFYETFFDDAKAVSKALNIVLTSRGKDKVPLAGIPFHSIDPYINKLIRQGFKVAIVEQLEDPKKAKGIVKRGLVRIVTPGTVLDESVLDEKRNNYLAAVSSENEKYGISAIDVSTGEFVCTRVEKISQLRNEINKFKPSEIIVAGINRSKKWVRELEKSSYVNGFGEAFFYEENARKNLKEHFDVMSLSGFGIEDEPLAVQSCGAIISYLKQTQMTDLNNVSTPRYYREDDYMVLDQVTIRNLEIIENVYDGSPKGSLISVLDNTLTSMGSRLLRSWLLRPLKKIAEIEKRQDMVEHYTKEQMEMNEIRALLKKMLDIQRLFSRITNNIDCPKDLIGLKKSLELIPKLKDNARGMFNEDVSGIVDLIGKSLEENPPSHIREGCFIRKGFDSELDEILDMSRNAKKYIANMEKEERERTGIKSLKIRYNKVFGYFIEVTKANLSLVPQHYIRKQTQVNSERFITEELKEKEEQILNSSERQVEIEKKLYAEIVGKIMEESGRIQLLASEVALIDVITNLAYAAVNNHYVRPVVTEGFDSEIRNGRHPVIETIEENYIPNDCRFNERIRVMIITGPNMSGKSSYMRMVALISIMAQAGSFVPAEHATLAVVDRIFTRIGAFDDISSGQSTFMVEMNETSNIMNNATGNSLIILDEIGRGTSTFDGISLAWAITEYIVRNIRAKTMFATHYHQLNRLADHYETVKNFNISVLEKTKGIEFLHKIEPGGTDRSYGIEVARLAGLPNELIENARKVMENLEIEDEISEKINPPKKKETSQMKLDEW